MSNLQPSISAIRFQLRTLPLGFNHLPAAAMIVAAPESASVHAADSSSTRLRTVPEAHRPTPAPKRTRWVGLAVFALLGLYATMAWTASLRKGLSFDEGLQIAVGYNIWLNDDLRIEGANGDLVKRWATLPLLLSRPRFVGQDDSFWKAAAPYEMAHEFFFLLGNQPEQILAQTRAMVALLGMATGLLVFVWSRELFGNVGGLVSLTLFVFSPHMLAFGGVVSTDMSITLTLCAVAWSVWRLLHHVSPGRIAGGLVLFAALVLAKPTALVILPVTALLIALKLLGKQPLRLDFFRHTWTLRRPSGQAIAIGAMVLAHALAGWGAIWAHYSFRYTASPLPQDRTVTMAKNEYRDGVAEPLRDTLRWLQRTRVLPEGFHRGVHSLVGADDETISFMNGSWAMGGRPAFFPYTMWVKTSPMLVALLAGAAVTWLWNRRSNRQRSSAAPTDAPQGAASFYALTPVFVLPLCYLAIAAGEDLNIGHRHILPIYPVFYILAGAVALGLGQWRKWRPALIALALGGVVAESLAMRPDYLAYISPQAGGPENGYKRLVDSSLDWGMELPALKQWQIQHDPQGQAPLFLAYFGTDNPTHHGIRSRRLPGFFDRRPVEAYALGPGYYAISATLLQGLYMPAYGAWRPVYERRYQFALQRMQELETRMRQRTRENLFHPEGADYWREVTDGYDGLRFARLCAWLRQARPPDHALGHSLLIWKLDIEELRAALVGPPVELADEPAPPRRYGRFTVLPEQR